MYSCEACAMSRSKWLMVRAAHGIPFAYRLRALIPAPQPPIRLELLPTVPLKAISAKLTSSSQSAIIPNSLGEVRDASCQVRVGMCFQHCLS